MPEPGISVFLSFFTIAAWHSVVRNMRNGPIFLSVIQSVTQLFDLSMGQSEVLRVEQLFRNTTANCRVLSCLGFPSRSSWRTLEGFIPLWAVCFTCRGHLTRCETWWYWFPAHQQVYAVTYSLSLYYLLTVLTTTILNYTFKYLKS